LANRGLNNRTILRRLVSPVRGIGEKLFIHSFIREVYMQRTHILPLLLFLIFSATGCGKSAETARLQLAQLNIAYTQMDFMEAARQGNLMVVGLFIDAGINLEARDGVGQTALMIATLANQPETVALLLARGADPNARDKYNGTALMTAVWKGNKEIVLSLLARDVDVNARADSGMTALMFAAWENHADIATILLEKGADPELADQQGWTASRRADFKGHTEVANLLRESQKPLEH
jgi:ankyrin repeat protein